MTEHITLIKEYHVEWGDEGSGSLVEICPNIYNVVKRVVSRIKEGWGLPDRVKVIKIWINDPLV